MEVRKIMTKNPACATPDSTLAEVAHMMEMYDCGCIPVVENHAANRPVGTITDRDITIRAVATEKNPLEMKASDIMTTNIVTVKFDQSVQECLKVMEERQIRRVLVVDKTGRVTGIVAQADLAEHASAQTADFVREVSETEREHENGESMQFSQERRQSTTRRNIYSDTNTKTESFSKSEKSSFINSTTLLMLLASVGIGAGIKYYLDSTGDSKKVYRHRPFTGDKIKTRAVDAPDMKINETTEGFTSGAANLTDTTRLENTGRVTGTVDTFDKTNAVNGDDLNPILEVGRTASR